LSPCPGFELYVALGEKDALSLNEAAGYDAWVVGERNTCLGLAWFGLAIGIASVSRYSRRPTVVDKKSVGELDGLLDGLPEYT
jgi:hypothetical protein